jgi:HipA-like protein
MSAEADVYRGEQLAGRIARTRHGSVFEYDHAYSGDVAFGLPRSRERFETHGVNLHTFFAGLLPEGLRLTALVRRVKSSADDLLSLLIAAGTDCVGDVCRGQASWEGGILGCFEPFRRQGRGWTARRGEARARACPSHDALRRRAFGTRAAASRGSRWPRAA